jgi:hypothetical protein
VLVSRLDPLGSKPKGRFNGPRRRIAGPKGRKFEIMCLLAIVPKISVHLSACGDQHGRVFRRRLLTQRKKLLERFRVGDSSCDFIFVIETAFACCITGNQLLSRGEGVSDVEVACRTYLGVVRKLCRGFTSVSVLLVDALEWSN